MNIITRWKKLISSTADPVTAEPHRRPTAPGTLPALAAELTITASLLSDPGCQRAINEDCGSWIVPEDEETLARKGRLMIVADGMGGHAAGETASRIAVEIITRSYFASSLPPGAALERAVIDANGAILTAARNSHRLTGMGTTCTALALHDGAAWSAQVGDSRLYLVRGGEIYLMTEDHSAVMEMVRRGHMTIAEARRHSDKNIILRALGVQREISVSLWQFPFLLQPDDYFVLCSDGLYDLVSDEEISNSVLNNDPASACAQMIMLARARGGHDNITAGIVHVQAA